MSKDNFMVPLLSDLVDKFVEEGGSMSGAQFTSNDITQTTYKGVFLIIQV